MIQAATPPGQPSQWPASLIRDMAARGLGQRRLAEASGISVASIRRYRAGRVPNPTNAARLRAVFGWEGDEVPWRVRCVRGMPVDFPTPGDRAVMVLLHAAARAAWKVVSPSRTGPGHEQRLRDHQARARARRST